MKVLVGFLLGCVLFICAGCTEQSTEVRITHGDKVWIVCRAEAYVLTDGGEIGFNVDGKRILLSGNWTMEEIGSCTYED